MSDKARSSKGKGKIDSDDEETGEQIPHSPPLVPPGVSSQDLSIFHTDYDRHWRGVSLEDYVKRQQTEMSIHEQRNKHSQISKARESPEEETDSEDYDPEAFNIRDFETYSTDSDAEKEEELIFELKISDTNRLVIPYDMASDHFPPLVIHPNSGETLQLIDPLQREWEMTLTYDDDANTFTITQGWSPYLQHRRLKSNDLIQFFRPIPQVQFNRFYIRHGVNFGPLLFEVTVPRSNRLPIPYDLAEKYFKPSTAKPPPEHLQEYVLLLTNHLNVTWKMRYVCNEDEKAYIIVRGWDDFAGHYNLKREDKIRFFERKPWLKGNCFMISHEPGPVKLESVLSPLCLRSRSNLLCELDLTEWDVGFGRLKMPGVKIPFQYSNTEMVKLTDENRKDWYMIFVCRSSSSDYMILDGWEGIVKEHELEAGDKVRFFIPAWPDNGKHFLIECAKKKKEGSCKGKEIAK